MHALWGTPEGKVESPCFSAYEQCTLNHLVLVFPVLIGGFQSLLRRRRFTIEHTHFSGAPICESPNLFFYSGQFRVRAGEATILALSHSNTFGGSAPFGMTPLHFLALAP